MDFTIEWGEFAYCFKSICSLIRLMNYFLVIHLFSEMEFQKFTDWLGTEWMYVQIDRSDRQVDDSVANDSALSKEELAICR